MKPPSSTPQISNVSAPIFTAVTLKDTGYWRATVEGLDGEILKRTYYRISINEYDNKAVPDLHGNGSLEAPFHYRFYEGDHVEVSCIGAYPLPEGQSAYIKKNTSQNTPLDPPDHPLGHEDQIYVSSAIRQEEEGTYTCTVFIIPENGDIREAQVTHQFHHRIDVVPRPISLYPDSGDGSEADPYHYIITPEDIIAINCYPLNVTVSPDQAGPAAWYYRSHSQPSYTHVPEEKLVHIRPYLSMEPLAPHGITYKCQSLLFDNLAIYHHVQVCKDVKNCNTDGIPNLSHPDDPKYTTGTRIAPWEFSRDIGQSVHIRCAYRKNPIHIPNLRAPITPIQWYRYDRQANTTVEFKPDNVNHILYTDPEGGGVINLVIIGIQETDYGYYACDRLENTGIQRYYHRIKRPGKGPGPEPEPTPEDLDAKISDPVSGLGQQASPWVHEINEREPLYVECVYQDPGQSAPNPNPNQPPYDSCVWYAVTGRNSESMSLIKDKIYANRLWIPEMTKKYYRTYAVQVVAAGQTMTYYHTVREPDLSQPPPSETNVNEPVQGEGTANDPYLHIGVVGQEANILCDPYVLSTDYDVKWYRHAADGSKDEVPGENVAFDQGTLYYPSLELEHAALYSCILDEADPEEREFYHDIRVHPGNGLLPSPEPVVPTVAAEPAPESNPMGFRSVG